MCYVQHAAGNMGLKVKERSHLEKTVIEITNLYTIAQER